MKSLRNHVISRDALSMVSAVDKWFSPVDILRYPKWRCRMKKMFEYSAASVACSSVHPAHGTRAFMSTNSIIGRLVFGAPHPPPLLLTTWSAAALGLDNPVHECTAVWHTPYEARGTAGGAMKPWA